MVPGIVVLLGALAIVAVGLYTRSLAFVLVATAVLILGTLGFLCAIMLWLLHQVRQLQPSDLPPQASVGYTGGTQSIIFCVWVLLQDGLHVSPFVSHTGGDGALRAAGLDPVGWLDWVIAVVDAVDEMRDQISKMFALMRNGEIGGDAIAQDVIDRGSNPLLLWHGDPAIGALLAALWARYTDELREQQRAEWRRSAETGQTSDRAHDKHAPSHRGRSPRWSEMQPFLDPPAFYRFDVVPYPEPGYLLLPARRLANGQGMHLRILLGSPTGAADAECSQAILDALAELHGSAT